MSDILMTQELGEVAPKPTDILEQHFFCSPDGAVFCIDVMPINQDTWRNEIDGTWPEIDKALAIKMTSPPDRYHFWNGDLGEWETTAALQAERLAYLRANAPELTPKQLRLILLENGVTSTMVDAALASIEDEVTREVATIEWQYGTGYQRLNPNLIMIATQLLGLTDEKIDEMWKKAITL